MNRKCDLTERHIILNPNQKKKKGRTGSSQGFGNLLHGWLCVNITFPGSCSSSNYGWIKVWVNLDMSLYFPSTLLERWFIQKLPRPPVLLSEWAVSKFLPLELNFPSFHSCIAKAFTFHFQDLIFLGSDLKTCFQEWS